MSNPRWLEPLPDAALMRATDAWAIEEKRVPSLDLMERAGEGLARVIAEHVPAGRLTVVCGKGNNGGDGLVAARLLRAAGRDVEVQLVWEAQWLSEDAQAMLGRLQGAAPVALRRRAALPRARDRRRAARHGHRRRAQGPGRGRDRRHQRRARADDRRRRAQRHRRLDRRGAGRGDPRRRHGRLPRRQAGPLDRAGQGARGGGRGDRHRHPARGAGRRRRRAGRPRGAARHPAPRRGLDQVHLRQRRRDRRLARAVGRALDGGARRDARRARAT